MTPANQRRFRAVAKELRTLAQENPDAFTCLAVIIRQVETLMILAADLHYRPDANK